MGESQVAAAENGGREVALPVLASTLSTAVVFFPVTLLAGVSKFLFTAMGLSRCHFARSLLLRRHDGGARCFAPSI